MLEFSTGDIEMPDQDDQDDSEPKARSKPALSLAVIAELKKAGFPKPPSVSWGDWMGPKTFNDRHQLIAMLRAQGKSNKQIAHIIGIGQNRLTIIINTARMQDLIQSYRNEYYGETADTTKRFKDMSPKVVDFLEETMESPVVNTATKLKAANEILNRAYGKPKETLEVQTSTVRDLFDALDKLKSGELDMFTMPEPSAPINVTPQEQKTLIAQNETLQHNKTIDTWVEQNIPKGVGIGKKSSS